MTLNSRLRLPTALTLAVAALPGAKAAAATLTVTSFAYDGGAPAFSLADGKATPTYAGWNPRTDAGHRDINGEGTHISFFGSSQACPSALNGPAGPLNAAGAAKLRQGSVAAPPAADAVVWSPQPDPVQCPNAAAQLPGPAFVAASAAGLQLLTAVMPSTSGASNTFWGQYAAAGEPGKHTNASIEGSFVAWNFDWKAGHAIHAWPNGGSGAVEISSDMGLNGVKVEAEAPGAPVNQAKQQYAVSFLNPDCQRELANKRTCQLRFMFTVGLVRKPGVNWSSLPRAEHARLMFDPAQGGLPVIEGPLQQSGGLTDTGGADAAALWTSAGAASRHSAFSSQHFAARIGFPQFLSALRLIAQQARPGAAQTDASNMAALFGPSWQDPGAWVIVSLNVAQEVHAPFPASPVFIQGTVGSARITVSR